jgi:thioredoxin-related protein
MKINHEKSGLAALIIFLIIAVSFRSLSGQDELKTGINWIKIEDAINRSSSQPRKLFIYIYSDNCGWCKRMNDVSFSDSIIANYINDHFYPVKINSSLKEDVTLGSRTFKYLPADPSKNMPAYHELVATLLNGRLAYPAISFLNEKMEYMGVDFGFKNPALLEAWLHFIAENEFLKTPDFSTFQSTFKGKL